MSSGSLTPEAEFLIDFNVQHVPAIVGMDISPAASAAMIGVTEADFVAHVDSVDADVRRVAEEMLVDVNLAQVVDELVLPHQGTVMTIGDSITTYRRGYARVLAAMVEIRRPHDGIRFLNVAQSGYTSTHCLEETFTRFLAEAPDLVFIKVGVGDSKRFGGQAADQLVSLDEYGSNVLAMVEAFLQYSSARPVLISPLPVNEAIANAYPGFEPMRMAWRNTDIEAKADALREIARRHDLTFVDLTDSLGRPPDPALLLDDGLHPNPNGHRRILEAVLRTLPSRPA
jgi:acyl-CoA thioesterase-1